MKDFDLLERIDTFLGDKENTHYSPYIEVRIGNDLWNSYIGKYGKDKLFRGIFYNDGFMQGLFYRDYKVIIKTGNDIKRVTIKWG